MPQENPTTKFKVDISELKAGMQEANRIIRLANSEFSAASSGMDNWADSTDGVTAKIKQLGTVQDAQNRKLALLQEQHRRVVDAQGADSAAAQKLQADINNQQAAVNKTTAELSRYESRLELVETAQRNAEKSGNSLESELRDLENALDDAEDAADDSSDGFTVFKGTLANLAAGAISGVISKVGDLVGSLLELPEATKEFRTVFSAAMQSAADSATGVDGAKKAFEDFYAVAADEGQAAEATSHLVDLAKNEKELQAAIDGVTGAWVEHGDSISIEGLSEAANETYKTGVLTGQMADAINWAGESEEEFQKKLDACSSEQERQKLVVSTLNNLYGENAKAYRENNASLLSTNEANLKLIQSQSELATAVEPLTAGLTTLKAKGIDMITPAISGLSGAVLGVVSGETTLGELMNAGVNWITKIGEGLVTSIPNLAEKGLTMVENFTGKIRENAPKLIQAGLGFIQNMVQGLMNALPTLISKVPTIVSNIANVINDNGPTILKSAVNIIWTIIKGLISAIPTLVANIPKIISAIVDVWSAFNWMNLGKNAITKLGDGIKALGGKMKTIGGNVKDWIVNAIKNLPENLKNLGKNAITNMGQAITNAKSSVTKGAKDIFDAVYDGVKKLPEKMLTIGKDLVKGLWNGISDMTGWVIDKIEGFGDSVLDGIKNFFGIESPSKLMRDEVGKFLAEGIGVGFTAETKETLKSMKNALSGTVGAVNAGLQSSGSAVGGGVVNNYTFNQTNNSPKPLSRLEIYRQTRNQFIQLQGV